MNYFEGDLVRLRALEPADAPFFFEWNRHSDMPRHLDWIWFPQSMARLRQWAEETSRKENESDEFFFVIETVEGTRVGTINSHDCDNRVGSFEYGVAIHPDHQRRGYARAAIKILLRYFFEELRYQKCTAKIVDFNEASIRLHESLGFQWEGRIRRLWFTNGRYHDELVYGLTIEEYEDSCGIQTADGGPPTDGG